MADSSSNARTKQVCGVCGSTNASSGSQLLRCGRCKDVSYCSKDCQRKDWPLHKTFCKIFARIQLDPTHYRNLPLDPNVNASYPALRIGTFNVPQDEFVFTGTILTEVDSSSVFTDLPATKALGYPLAIASVKDHGTTEYNQAAALLAVDVDPESSSFGLPPQPGPMYEGDFIVVRTDGKHMKMLHMSYLLAYLYGRTEQARELKKQEESGEEEDLQSFMERVLHPWSLARAFERFRQSQAEAGKPGWADIDAPVQAGLVTDT
ncbi:hypothetical protein LTR10_001386 [Elasticomyces elasticus]|nr:hypothetical protein LTR10_001386 [Elasticomyces elasticus]KAK4974887.1 hypothetical protein LTR42_004096 [Elasticomyces elasticus]